MWLYLDSIPAHHRFHEYSGYSRNHRFGRTNGHFACFVPLIDSGDSTRNHQVIQVYSTIVRSSDLKIANPNNNPVCTMITDDPTVEYVRSVEDVCIPMITWFDRLMFVFRNMEGNIMRLNGEFDLQLTIDNVYDEVPSSILQMSQLSIIKVLGNTTKKEVNVDNPFSFDQCSISSVSLSTVFLLLSVPNDRVILTDAGIW